MIRHLESHLGKIYSGWQDNSDNKLQVVLFKNQPQFGISTYSTLGLSDFILDLKGEKKVRQEFIFSIYERYESPIIAQHLTSFSEGVIKTGKGLLRGEVIGPGKPFINGSQLVGLYASSPAFFEDSFHIYEGMNPPVVFVWLMPLLLNEIHFVRNNGWNEFETILETKDCDFWDINRDSILDPI
jgi:hypothetical protein